VGRSSIDETSKNKKKKQQEMDDGRFLCVLWSRDWAEGRGVCRVRVAATWDVAEER
jgi:hypothetical protein